MLAKGSTAIVFTCIVGFRRWNLPQPLTSTGTDSSSKYELVYRRTTKINAIANSANDRGSRACDPSRASGGLSLRSTSASRFSPSGVISNAQATNQGERETSNNENYQ